MLGPGARCAAIVAAWLELSALVGRAQAEGAVLRRPALHWVRAEGATTCVDPRTLAQRVEELVGPVLVRAADAEHSIEASVEARGSAPPAEAPGGEGRVAGTLRVRVRVVDVGGHTLGERVLEQASGDCRALTPAIAFVVAMMIDPGVAAHGLPGELVALFGGDEPAEERLLDELESAPPAPPAPAAPPRAPAPLAPDRTPRVEPRFQAAALMRAAYRDAPRALLSAEARLLYELRRPLAVLGFVRGGTQAGEHQLNPAHSVRVSELALGILACAGHGPAPVLRVHGCFGLEVAATLAAGSGFEQDERALEAAAAFVMQLTARLRLKGAWGLAAALSGRYALRVRQFNAELDGTDSLLFRVPRTAVGIALGPSYEF